MSRLSSAHVSSLARPFARGVWCSGRLGRRLTGSHPVEPARLISAFLNVPVMSLAGLTIAPIERQRSRSRRHRPQAR